MSVPSKPSAGELADQLASDPSYQITQHDVSLLIIPALRSASPVLAMPDREKMVEELNAQGFTSRDGTYLQGPTVGVIDAILALLQPSPGGK